MPMNVPGVRDPGGLPNVYARVERLQALLAGREIDESLREIIEGILQMAETQHVLNLRLWDGSRSIPFPHADTHIPGAGDALPVGPPVGLGNDNDEGSALSFVRQDHVHKRDVRVKAEGVDVATRNAIDFRASTLITWSAVDDPGNDEVDITPTLSTSAATISRGGTVLAPTTTHDIEVWRAPYAATVLAVKAYQEGGSTGSTINARKNGSSQHLSSDLSIGTLGTWLDGGSVQNTAYAVGDSLEIQITGVSGSPTLIAIQVDLLRT